MRTTTELPEAQARLDELVGLSDTNTDQSDLRAKLNGSEPVLLHAGVLAHSDVFVWYTLRAYRDPDHITVVVFELELASDSDLPDDLQLVCRVGDAIFAVAAGKEIKARWTADATQILNKKNNRIGRVSLSLDDKFDT